MTRQGGARHTNESPEEGVWKLQLGVTGMRAQADDARVLSTGSPAICKPPEHPSCYALQRISGQTSTVCAGRRKGGGGRLNDDDWPAG